MNKIEARISAPKIINSEHFGKLLSSDEYVKDINGKWVINKPGAKPAYYNSSLQAVNEAKREISNNPFFQFTLNANDITYTPTAYAIIHSA